MDRKLVDVNALAVFLDESHVGHPYVRRALAPGFTGEFQVLISAYHLMRTRWVLVNKWGVPTDEADGLLTKFAQIQSPFYVAADGAAVGRAISIAKEVHHDVYDCFLGTMAAAAGATHLFTTDRGFSRVCDALGLVYENPIPDSVLRRFGVTGRAD